MLTVDASGTVTQRLTPPKFASQEARGGQTFSAAVAWRTVSVPGGGYAMVHQRGLVDEVPAQNGGYGSFNPCDAIVQTAVMVATADAMPKSVPAIPGMVLPVDIAISPDGKRVALIAAGNATNAGSPGGAPVLPRVFAADITDVSDPSVGCRNDGRHGPCQPNIFNGSIDAGTDPVGTGTISFDAGAGAPNTPVTSATAPTSCSMTSRSAALPATTATGSPTTCPPTSAPTERFKCRRC
ncbi:MAG TPA: hypothetical protein VH374_03435 [Polyangia bacterium]|nr:hypothetical protein [Polyangia bacterium]